MDAPAVTYADLGRWLDGHVASRWPVCTSVIASMLGFAATRVRVVGKLIASAAKCTPRQHGARRTDWRLGQQQDLGPRFTPRCWTFVDFHVHAAAAAPICRRSVDA